jgi:membrane glycosyltransferase
MAGEELTGSRAGATSHVRTSEPSLADERLRCQARVEEYLAALGLTEEARNAALARDIVQAVESSSRGLPNPSEAVAEAQRRVAAFEFALFDTRANDVQPLWWRSFIEAHPNEFLGDVPAALRAVARFGDPFAGVAPRAMRFGDPMRVGAVVPRWLLILALPVALTFAALGTLVHGLGVPRGSPLAVVWVTCFAALFGLVSIGFTAALVGFVAGFRAPRVRRSEGPLPRTAVLIPVYNESAEQVFAAILAMRESLARTGAGDAFELVVLCAAEEERAFRRASAAGEGPPLYYRRRTRNERQKAGNLAEFFERYGNRYTYAVVLDADSLMSGATMVEMVRRMEAEPNLALLQAPLLLHRAESLFARAQQFVASVVGPVFMRGLAVWAGEQGNYYGHNAVVRVQAFVSYCALPVLRGEPPFGGHILSHDFVEAALLCRAGYDVRIAHDLGGSYEELPQSLPDYVARDRRWCQGNLQHLRIALSPGFRPMSRLHMLVGAFAYLASPLWLLFVLLSLGLAQSAEQWLVRPSHALLLVSATATMLFLPRVFALVEVLRSGSARRGHGGVLSILASSGFETGLSVVLAPLMMLHHTRIVLSIVSGQAVRWAAQQRGARSERERVIRPELFATLLGALGASATLLAPSIPGPWLALLWGPWLLAVPIALTVSSASAGALCRRLGLLLVPSELAPDELSLRAEDYRVLTAADGSARFRDIVLDPVLNRAHQSALLAKGTPRRALASDGGVVRPSLAPNEPERSAELDTERGLLRALCERAVRGGPTALSVGEQARLLADVESVATLHREAWRNWPVETWGLSRLAPQLPPPLGTGG